LSTGIAAMVVQFGLAMMPLRASPIACGLTSLTTSGTSGSMRQALLLSITVAPAAAYFGASSFDVRHRRRTARCRGRSGRRAASSTVTFRPSKVSVVPADRPLANRPQLGDGEGPLGEQAQHHRAHLAGGADDAHAQAAVHVPAHRPVPA
jgi:hypothetical protein